MKKYIFITILAMLAARTAGAQEPTCYAKLEKDTLKVGNALIERAFAWNGGALRTLWVKDVKAGITLESSQTAPDFLLIEGKPENARLDVISVPESNWDLPCFTARITYNVGQVQVRREYLLNEGVAAIACETFIKGVWDGQAVETPILDQFYFPGKHWHCKAVEFHDVTDNRNNLVEEHPFISYRTRDWRGNILLARDAIGGGGFFFIKEAPCSDMQVPPAKGDFRIKYGRFQVTGIGFEPSDILEDEWTCLYCCALGVTGRTDLDEALSLRAYQKTLRVQKDMVMMNTWGDRSQDGRVSEAFCLQELDKAARLGITVFQIDDGWQVGKSPASVTEGGSFDNIWDRDGYWDVDSLKFPHGLKPIVDKADGLGIKIGLWFNPSVKDDFAAWEKDAEVLIGLWREYGISIFKIDGLIIPTKRAERNLRSMLNRVREETGDAVIFNMDVTNGRRIGYHWFAEYGNIFLENRYTDWANYYPYKTLRNLWQLSRYVAPERFQIEFLNPCRNADKYPDGDPFAPSNYSFDYLAAITFAAQPLAWLEASNLPDEAFATGDLLRGWYKIAPDFHAGSIFPIGEEPSGRSWTGFQSIKDKKHGYLLIYREATGKARGRIKTCFPGRRWVRLKPVLGDGKSRLVRVDADGFIKVRLREPNSFVLYEY